MIYHEHLCYYSLATFERLLGMHGLCVVDVDKTAAHGGSLRVYAAKSGAEPVSQEVASLRAEEVETGLGSAEFYRRFADQACALRDELVSLLRELSSDGRRIAVYGAAAKTTVLLNFFGIGRDVIDYVADRNPHKQGRLVPGPDIPVVPAGRIFDDRPDFVLILAWNYADEIMSQLSPYAKAGGRFIVPIPEMQVL